MRREDLQLLPSLWTGPSVARARLSTHMPPKDKDPFELEAELIGAFQRHAVQHSCVSTRTRAAGQGWRQRLTAAIPAVAEVFGHRHQHLHEPQIYHFGLYQGVSVRFIDGVATAVSSQPPKHFGFDSFQGLPPSKVDVTDAWHEGKYAADPRQMLRTALGQRVDFVEGFYNESLADDGLVKARGMRPALYVDIDCDLYESTLPALQFLHRNHLIQPGTIVGFDDWWTYPCAPGNEGLSPLDVGEGRAHAELAKQFDVEFMCLTGPCTEAASPPNCSLGAHLELYDRQEMMQLMFVAVSVGAGRGRSGFNMTSEQVRKYKATGGPCVTFHKNRQMGGRHFAIRDKSTVGAS